MYRIITMILVCMFSFACAGKQAYFIPASPLTPQEVEDGIREIAKDPEFSLEDAKKRFGDGSRFSKFREDDVRAAFPELMPEDTQVSLCIYSTRERGTIITFLAPPQQKTVVLKLASCGQRGTGLQCNPLVEREMYFFEKPKNTFELENGATYEEAIHILSLFKWASINGNMPKGFSYESVTIISKTPAGYRLALAGRNCGGCSVSLDIKIQSGQIVLLKNPEQMCF
ncbi:hypothetical protein L9G15_08075 [Shewanella sp. A3A]|nr:hypothetical protein [Shewanella ferrihydritica]